MIQDCASCAPTREQNRVGEAMTNTLYYGDNLSYLREFERGSIDLIYLDPPFNSQAIYNLLFRDPTGKATPAQTTAFKDMWNWEEDGAQDAYADVLASGSAVAPMLRSFHSFLRGSPMMAYLAMMSVRLIEMHRVLAPTGSLFLHCDPTASPYLRILLDAVFGPERFINELIWRRTTPKGLAFTRFASNHDVILFHRRGDEYVWNPQYMPYSDEYLQRYNLIDEASGRRFQATSLLNPNPDPIEHWFKGKAKS